MKVSVILSAYCGSKYLKEQLESIVHQTRIPDEVIIIDDDSPDGGATVQIINEYCSNYPFINKHINERNLGWERSFMHGIALVSKETDIVFFSDQDDIWELSKIEKMESLFLDESVDVVISDCQYVDETLNPIESHTNSNSLKSDKYVFDKKFINPKGVGAAMAIRKRFADNYISLWNPSIGHDRFFQIVAVVYDKLYYYDAITTYHRIHGNNATGKKVFDTESRIVGIQGNIELVDSILNSALSRQLSDSRKKVICGYLSFANHRLLMLKNGSLWRWITLPLYGLGYYPTSKTWYGDLRCIWRR